MVLLGGFDRRQGIEPWSSSIQLSGQSPPATKQIAFGAAVDLVMDSSSASTRESSSGKPPLPPVGLGGGDSDGRVSVQSLLLNHGRRRPATAPGRSSHGEWPTPSITCSSAPGIVSARSVTADGGRGSSAP